MTRPTFYLTTAIDYVNSLPHLGTAYEKIAADVLARYMRLAGFDTFFSMGNDEHSQNVEREAQAQGLAPLVYCDRMAEQFEATWKKLNVSYDRFVRTTEEAHRRAVEEVFRRIQQKGDVYRASYKGHYCVSCEAFLQEKDLVEGKCPHHQTAPQWIEEENYFFALSRYRDALLEHMQGNPQFVRPESRFNEILRVLEGGLEDVSVSRSSRRWGIPLPEDPGHVIYVWFDALINYLTSTGFPDDMMRFQRYWPAQVHIIGKDITRFHCIIWPAMLLSAGLPLPESIFGHGWVTFKGERMSKSLGNIVRPLEAVDLLGPDPLRYFLMREVAFGRDGDFSWEAFIARYNADLANDLGNLVNRTLTMITRYLDGRVPEEGDAAETGLGGEAAADLRRVAEESTARYLNSMEELEFHAGLTACWDLVRRANRFVEETAPWTLAAKGRDARPDLETALYHLLECCRLIALEVFPVMPAKAEELWRSLGLHGSVAEGEFPRDLIWRSVWGDKLGAGRIAPGEPLFPRIAEVPVDETGERPTGERPAGAHPGKARVADRNGGEMTHPEESKKPSPEAPPPASISLQEFSRIDLRVATVTAVERVPKTDRLLRFEVTLGSETRQIVAGIGAQYAPEDLVGKQIILVTNLEAAVLRGIRSEGMLLAADDQGRPIILQPASYVAPGTPVR